MDDIERVKFLEMMEDNIMDHTVAINKYIQYCDFVIRCHQLDIIIDYDKYLDLLNFARIAKPVDKDEWFLLQKYQTIINNLYNENKKTK